MPKTFFILAGEASGDKHAAKLVAQLKAQAPGSRCIGLGGPAMSLAGFEAFKDLDGMQVVGFWEVAKQYGFFKKVFYELLDKVKQSRPDALICVDYPGFNLRFAAEVKKLGIPVLYYIVPQVWAWKPLRAKKMARYVDRAFCVFGFEPPFFEKHGLKTEFVGHPLVDHATDPAPSQVFECGFQNAANMLHPRPIAPREDPLETARKLIAPHNEKFRNVCLLPGSRESEIRQHLKPMRDGFKLVRAKHPATRMFISLPDPERAEKNARKIEILAADGDTLNAAEAAARLNALPVSHSLLLPAIADFSVVKSGTSTLEAGLAGKPLCVLYKGSTASYLIAKLLINIPVFSLVNIVLGRYAVPELLQREVNPRRLAAEIERGLFDETYRKKQRAALVQIPSKLGGPGASARAAKRILDFINGTSPDHA